MLGGMLLSKDAIADVVEVDPRHDFYRPAHEARLRRDHSTSTAGASRPTPSPSPPSCRSAASSARVGGAPYLHTLHLVGAHRRQRRLLRADRARAAVLRRLIEAGTRIVQLGYGTGDGDVDDIVDAAQAEVYAVTDRRTSEDYLPLVGDHGGRRSTRSRRSAPAAARWSACRPGSPTSTG